MSTTRDLTATTFVVHNGKVLLHRHRKLGLILPLGGHVEPNELPEHAALREVKEESGLNVVLYDPALRPEDRRIGEIPLYSRHPDAEETVRLVQPVAVLLENIEAGHQHIDLIYLATLDGDFPSGEAGPLPAGTGPEELEWLDRGEVMKKEMPKNVRILALHALDLLAGPPGHIGPPVYIAGRIV